MPTGNQQSGVAFNLASVLRDEAESIDQLGRRRRDLELTPPDPCPTTATNRIPDRLGLAFSGGGIRSASVCLGVLQELARINVLPQVHYISAVSGGGYILGWLAAWIKRAGFESVNAQLASGRAEEPAVPGAPLSYDRFLEPFPLRFLRDYAAYLTPRTGILTGDSWAAGAVYLRNLLLNLLLLVMAAVGVLAVLQLLSPALFWTLVRDHNWLVIAFAILFLAGLTVTFLKSVRALQCIQAGQDPEEGPELGWRAVTGGIVAAVGLWVVTPEVISAFSAGNMCVLVPALVIAVASLVCIAWAELSLASKKRILEPVDPRLGGYRTWLVAGALCSGALCALCLYWMEAWLIRSNGSWVGDSYVVLGLPAWLTVIALASFIQIGVLGDAFPDAQREWVGRLAGYYLMAGCCAGLLLLIALLGPLFMQYLFVHAKSPSTLAAVLAWVLPGGWVFTVLAGLLSGQSSKTGGNVPKKRVLEVLAVVAPPVFLLGLLLLLSWGTHTLVMHWASPSAEYLSVLAPVSPAASPPSRSANAAKPAASPGSAKVSSDAVPYGKAPASSERSTQPAAAVLGEILAVCAAAFLLLRFRLDANEFAMHLFYRNRLVRTFLGASNAPGVNASCRRKPSPFTRFAYDDDMALEELRPKDRTPQPDSPCEGNYDGPYPIWCGTLNLTRNAALAAQQRKGASFIYSPLYCGWDYVGDGPANSEAPDRDPPKQDTGSGETSKFAYRRSYPWKDGNNSIAAYGGTGGKTYIGTAMAACGAAVSPNWGYHTKSSVAALLALFNVRTGCWMGNPRHNEGWRKYAPSAVYLLRELCGFANDKSKYVYISDGGHFENLGIYEQIRRRVRFIIAVDADADPDYQFGDLGNAVEKCRRDFGTEITMFGVSRIRPQEIKKEKSAHYAVGAIKYPRRYKGDPQTNGILLYMKNSLTGDEPSDIFSAKKVDAKFPHDSTLNQFFNETQFEGYRALGQHMLHAVWSDCCESLQLNSDENFAGPHSSMQVQRLYSFLGRKSETATSEK